nr:unnamed protein product [Callosobruchus analis]
MYESFKAHLIGLLKLGPYIVLNLEPTQANMIPPLRTLSWRHSKLISTPVAEQ